jgi:hypothetical protein
MATTQTNRLQAGAIQPVSRPEPTSTALKPIEPGDLSEVMTFAQIAVKSGTFGLKNVEEAAFRILYGRELGLTSWASIMGVQMIQGQPSLKAATAAALIRRSGIYDFSEVESTPTACELAFYRYGKHVGSTRFTLDDAKRAGLLGKPGPWQAYPQRMLLMRARAWAIRDGAADALMGLQVAEEVSDYGPDAARDVTPQEPTPRRGGVVYADPDPVIDEILEDTPDPATATDPEIEAQIARELAARDATLES